MRHLPISMPPHLFRYLGGIAVLLLTLAVYRSDTAMQAMRTALFRDMQRAMAAVIPPTGATRMMKVPFHRQEHSLSCEIASLRSALLAVGFDVSEEILISALPRDTTPKKTDATGNITWGDPDVGFVGDIDGRMPSTGYGVHAPPIKEVAQLYAAVNDIRVNDAAALTRAIDRGHPVIAWSALGKSPRTLPWKTPAGKTIHAALYEHTVVVAGYKGSAAAIASVFIVDPLTGLREESWETFVWRTGFLKHQGLEIIPVRF